MSHRIVRQDCRQLVGTPEQLVGMIWSKQFGRNSLKMWSDITYNLVGTHLHTCRNSPTNWSERFGPKQIGRNSLNIWSEFPLKLVGKIWSQTKWSESPKHVVYRRAGSAPGFPRDLCALTSCGGLPFLGPCCGHGGLARCMRRVSQPRATLHIQTRCRPCVPHFDLQQRRIARLSYDFA